MDEYTKTSKRKLIVVILSIIILPLGYFGIFYLQVQNGEVKTLRTKYSTENRKKICPWSANKTYLSCMRKDFYRLLRNTGPFASQLAFQFETEVFRFDRDLQSSDIGKVNSYLDHLDLALNFLLIEKSYRMSRSRINVPGIVLSKFNREMVLKEVFLFSGYFKKIRTQYSQVITSDKFLHAKLIRLEKELKRITPSLRASF